MLLLYILFESGRKVSALHSEQSRSNFASSTGFAHQDCSPSVACTSKQIVWFEGLEYTLAALWKPRKTIIKVGYKLCNLCEAEGDLFNTSTHSLFDHLSTCFNNAARVYNLVTETELESMGLLWMKSWMFPQVRFVTPSGIANPNTTSGTGGITVPLLQNCAHNRSWASMKLPRIDRIEEALMTKNMLTLTTHRVSAIRAATETICCYYW